MIGITPNQGYRRAERQSALALRWLQWIAHSRGIHIQHARNMGEKRIGNYKVDGYAAASNTVFEFQGYTFVLKSNINKFYHISAAAPFMAVPPAFRTGRRKFLTPMTIWIRPTSGH